MLLYKVFSVHDSVHAKNIYHSCIEILRANIFIQCLQFSYNMIYLYLLVGDIEVSQTILKALDVTNAMQ